MRIRYITLVLLSLLTSNVLAIRIRYISFYGAIPQATTSNPDIYTFNNGTMSLINPSYGLNECLEGVTAFRCSNSIFAKYNSDGTRGRLDGYYRINPVISGNVVNRITVTGDTTLNGNLEGVTIAIAPGVTSQISGSVRTFSKDTIRIPDSDTILNVGFDSPVSTNIFLGGGGIRLTGDLKLSGTGANLVGPGTVNFNSRSLIFDGSPRTVGNILQMNNAADWQFYSKVTVTGELIFDGDGYILGHGNILDLSLGGTIRLKDNTSISMSNLKLRGLGTGRILFDDPTSQLRLSNIEVEMNRDITFTTGGIYAEGPTTIVTKDNILTFDQASSLTVDGITLLYDTLSFPNQDNIQPTMSDDPLEKHVVSLNNGVIRRLDLPTLGDIHLVNNYFLDGLLVVSPDRQLYFDDSVTLDGQTHFAIFTKANQTLVNVSDGKTARTKNISLQYFSPSYENLGTNAALIFDDATKIDLAKNEDLVTTWTFEGNCVINGDNHTLNLGTLGKIVLNKRGTSLLFDNITLKGISGSQIICMDNTCTVSFKNVRWIQDGTYTFTSGRFEVLESLEMSGNNVFVYSSNKQSKILSSATMSLDRGMTFSYDPITDNRTLIALEDASSTLFMNGATLASTTTGLRLTNGNLLIDHKNYFRNDGAISMSQGITFGNGNSSDDLLIKLMPGGNVNVISGQLVYENVN